ncbi:hypothetical protein [Moorena sp. SIO3I6]|nr:hypothetical protein [Moorena sp. SIO3I6]
MGRFNKQHLLPFATPYSLLPTPYSLLPVPYSLFPLLSQPTLFPMGGWFK